MKITKKHYAANQQLLADIREFAAALGEYKKINAMTLREAAKKTLGEYNPDIEYCSSKKIYHIMLYKKNMFIRTAWINPETWQDNIERWMGDVDLTAYYEYQKVEKRISRIMASLQRKYLRHAIAINEIRIKAREVATEILAGEPDVTLKNISQDVRSELYGSYKNLMHEPVSRTYIETGGNIWPEVPGAEEM